MKKKQLIKTLKLLSEKVCRELHNDPNRFFTEADFQTWVYNELKNQKEWDTEFEDNTGIILSKIHLEYPRFNKGNLIKQGRYDISIIRNPKKKTDPLFYNKVDADRIDYFPTRIAFELKSKWNSTPREIKEKLEDDLGIFDDETLYDYGVVFHLSLNRNSNGREKIRDNDDDNVQCRYRSYSGMLQ